MEVSQEVKDLLGRMLGDYNRSLNDAEAKRAKADPKGNKLTRVMEGKHGLNYHWHSAGLDGKGRSVYFCWSLHRNAAGYFLGWRQVHSKPRGKRGAYTVKRDRWIARKAKWRAKQVAERRRDAFLEAMACPVCNHPGGRPTARKACPGCGAVRTDIDPPLPPVD